jgi:hypothetical protein
VNGEKLTYEIAFFNLLRNLIPNKLEHKEYNFFMDDIEKKLEMDRSIIRGLVKNLESDKLIKVLSESEDNLEIFFEPTYEHLLEIFSIEGIENMIKEIQFFIKNNHESFQVTSDEIAQKFTEYALEANSLVEKNGIEADLNEIISKGVSEILNDEKINTLIKKRIYNLCKEAKEEDLKVLEGILFCEVHFLPTENPFYVTLFLTKLVSYMKKSN